MTRSGRSHLVAAGRAASVVALLALLSSAPALAISSLADDAPERCPYDFRSDMPPGEFCVYRGAITSEDGAVCVDDAIVIWSSHDEAAPENDRGPDGGARDVFFGFLEPSLVMHGVAPARTSARLVDYSPTEDRLDTPLDGLTTVGPGSITMKLSGSVAIGSAAGGCQFDSYRGVFVGLMQAPQESASIELDARAAR